MKTAPTQAALGGFLKRGGLVLFLGALTAAVGCDGDNLFGTVETSAPRVVELTVPDQVFSGQSLDVRARVAGDVPLDSVVVRARGAFSDEAAVTLPERQVSASVDASLEVPEEVNDTVADVSVFVADVRGNVSEVASATVRVIDTTPPQVSVTVGAEMVALGKAFEVTVESTDNVGLSEVGFRAFFIEGGDTLAADSASVSGRQGTVTFTHLVEDSAPEGELRIEAFARDVDGNQALSEAASPLIVVFVDEEVPTIQVSLPNLGSPAEHPIGKELLVEALFSDNGGVVNLRFDGVAHRGDRDLGTDVVVPRFEENVTPFAEPVSDSTIRRILVPVLTDSTEEVAYVRAAATDAQGNVEVDSVAVTLRADLAPPTIQIDQPTAGAGIPAQDSVLVDVDVTEPDGVLASGLVEVRIEGVRFEGDPQFGTFAEIQTHTPKVVTFSPPRTGTTQVQRFVVPTPEAESGSAYIRVTSRDAWGNESKDSVEVRLGAPRVEILNPEDGDEVAQGSQLTVRVRAIDELGVRSVEIQAGGDVTLPSFPVIQTFDPAQDTVVIEETVSIPSETGAIEFTATATNVEGVEGSVGPIQVNVVDQELFDETPPELRVRFLLDETGGDPRRVEVTDQFEIEVEGRDNSGGSGVKRVGMTLLASPRGGAGTPASIQVTGEPASLTPTTGTFTTVFQVPLVELVNAGVLDLLQTPDTVDLELFGWMVDDQDNCAAAVAEETFQSLTCVQGEVNLSDTVAAGVSGQTDFVVGVSGQTVLLPDGGEIADAVVDPDDTRQLLFLANIGLSRVEVFDLGTRQFETSPILVGAEPWGLTFSRTDSDSLLVANSGGTNLSIVSVPDRSEDVDRRIFTPNTLLWDVQEGTGEGGVTFEASFTDFSDRPQFIAQDQTGRIVYSTRPTGSAPDGTIRLIEFPPPGAPLGGDTEPEVFLFTRHGATSPRDNAFAISNVDRVDLSSAGLRMRTRIPFHLPDPGCTSAAPPNDGNELCTPFEGVLGATELATAALRDSVQANTAQTLPGMFLPQNRGGEWIIESVGLSDTTFISASGDGRIVAIGEGATAPTGRILLWDAQQQDISDNIDVVDLVGNASERVLGVDMNADGTLGAARGIFAVYFFDEELRLQGTAPLEDGGAGVALHPLHENGPVGTTDNTALAFVPIGDGRVDIFNTVNFNRRGRAHIRDVITGPLRASLPFPGDNDPGDCPLDPDGAVDLASSADDCVVVKLYGITSAGGVVVIDVTVADVTRFD